MSKELFEFMVSKNVASFHLLEQYKGKTVDAIYNRMNPNGPPMQIKTKGTLEKVDDFVSVQIGGKTYPFASKDGIIVEIVDDASKTSLYDASLVVNNNTKFTEKTRFALGLPNADSRYAYVAKKQFNENLNK